MAEALPQTIPHAAALAARRWGDAPALVEQGETWSFNQLWGQCRAAASALLLRGVREGDRIAIWAPNSRDWVVAGRPTIADVSLCSYLYYPEPFGFARADWPHIDRWLDRIAALPGWQHPYDLMTRAFPPATA